MIHKTSRQQNRLFWRGATYCHRLEDEMCATNVTDQFVKGFPLKWGIPNSWMVYFMENLLNKWLMTGGTPISSETSTMVGICLEPNRTEKVPKPCLEPS